MSQHILEVEKALLLFPKRTSSQNPEAYIGGGQSQLRYIGLRVPHLQQAMQKGFSFSHKKPQQVAKIWNQIWLKSDCFEVMSMALAWFYDPKQKSLVGAHWTMLKRWSARIDNWAHSDTLSGIYARILEQNRQLIYPTFVKWNSSKNPWLRRLSIVSLIYYKSQRKRVLPLNLILDLVHPQLEYNHYYVQKGVGWTLREAYNAYPDKVSIFVEKYINQISSIALSAATEKMPFKQKQRLKNLRRAPKGRALRGRALNRRAVK